LKTLVYVLLVLNLAFFAWYQAQPPGPAPVPRLAPMVTGAEPLVLLSERTRQTVEDAATPTKTGPPVIEAPAVDASPEAAPREQETPAVAAVEVEALPECRSIGPIPSNAQATDLLSRLVALGYSGVLREGETQLPTGYQVYLPAMGAEKAAEIVDALKAAGMDDYFVGKRHRISLGIFTDKAKAMTRQQAVRELGYDAVLEARFKKRSVYWIDIEESRPVSPADGDWQTVMADYPDIQVQQVSCE